MSSIALTAFARNRLFPGPQFQHKIQGVTPDEFETYLNEHEPLKIEAGYAGFCQLFVYENWTDSRCMAVKITKDNQHLLRSGYEARTKQELPVLTRWFEGITAPKANYLIVILYSREQMQKEGEGVNADWGVVGCLPVAEPTEMPMAPITIMRNALGVEEGGSGVPIDREAYQRSVDFWQTHANWR